MPIFECCLLASAASATGRTVRQLSHSHRHIVYLDSALKSGGRVSIEKDATLSCVPASSLAHAKGNKGRLLLTYTTIHACVERNEETHHVVSSGYIMLMAVLTHFYPSFLSTDYIIV